MQKIRKIGLLIISILLLNSLFINCYATSVAVTEENLNKVLQSFVSSDANQDNYEITMSDEKMTIEVDGKTYIVNYDLTGNPQFTLSIPIKQGMTYNEFEEQTHNLSMPGIGYIGVANLQGVDMEDASTYFAMCLLKSAFSSMTSGSSEYIIATDGTTVESSDATVIYESDFGNHVMEYVNSIYSTKQTFSDSTEMEGFDTFTWTIEETDVTSTSCNLLSTLTVNLDADFSKIKGYALYDGITEQSADYAIKLKVGQKCQIQSSEKIIGYELSGSSCVEFNDNKDVITAVKVGTTNGYLYVGNSDNKKSIYISVEENTDNSTLDPIVLKLESGTTNNNNTGKASNDNTISATILPKAGTNITIVLIIGISLLVIIILKIKLKQCKDIQ